MSEKCGITDIINYNFARLRIGSLHIKKHGLFMMLWY